MKARHIATYSFAVDRPDAGPKPVANVTTTMYTVAKPLPPNNAGGSFLFKRPVKLYIHVSAEGDRSAHGPKRKTVRGCATAKQGEKSEGRTSERYVC